MYASVKPQKNRIELSSFLCPNNFVFFFVFLSGPPNNTFPFTRLEEHI